MGRFKVHLKLLEDCQFNLAHEPKTQIETSSFCGKIKAFLGILMSCTV